MDTLARTDATGPNVALERPDVVEDPGSAQDRLVAQHLALARSLARRFRFRGEATEDLEQVAYLALVKAARRFDPDRQVKFSTYATVSVVGELKRHFRDRTWGLRVPRSIKERSLEVRLARSELQHERGGSPTIAEVAERLQLSEEAVLEAMEASRSHFLASLDERTPTGQALIDGLSSDDDPFSPVLDRHRLAELLPDLACEERLVLKRYFVDGWTQAQVGAELGVSQMQVSRIMARTLGCLRSRW